MMDETLLALVNLKYGFNLTLKKEQMEVISSIMAGNHTFGFLPTGFGKSLTFTLPPLLHDEAEPANTPHVSLIVSPLRSLMFDQVVRARLMGIKSVAITKMADMDRDDIESIKQGNVSLVYGSPEALQSGPWLTMMQRYSKRVCLVVMDEVHCLSEWGADFRPDYLKMVELRGKFSKAPILGLSATVNSKVFEDIKECLMLQNQKISVISLPPDRPNIFLGIVHKKSYDYEEDLQWIVSGLKVEKANYPKTIIFCNSIMTVFDIYAFIKNELGVDAYVNGNTHDVRLISMYHGEIGTRLQEYTLETFRKKETILRVLVSTIAFGMGVEVVDIRQVVHWGKSKSLLTHWQEVGRAGRDGKAALALWYPKTVGGDDKDIFESMRRNEEQCIRMTILGHFMISGTKDSLKPLDSRSSCTGRCKNCTCQLCSCCTHCKNKCRCKSISSV